MFLMQDHRIQSELYRYPSTQRNITEDILASRSMLPSEAAAADAAGARGRPPRCLGKGARTVRATAVAVGPGAALCRGRAGEGARTVRAAAAVGRVRPLRGLGGRPVA